MSAKVTDGFDTGDDEKVVAIFDKWKGGPLSDKLFTRISKIAPLCGVITVIFRKNAGRLETLLLPRPNDDPTWPGMLNLPGKMFMAKDFRREDKTVVNGPFERIQDDEIKTKFISRPEFAGTAFQNTRRGPILALTYIAKLSKKDETLHSENWFEVDKLGNLKNLIDTELIAIDIALDSYLAGSNHLPSL